MRFRMVRWSGRVCLSGAVLLALSCGLAASEDVQQLHEEAGAAAGVLPVDSMPQPLAVDPVPAGQAAQVELSPMDDSHAELHPIAADKAGRDAVSADAPPKTAMPNDAKLTPLEPVAEQVPQKLVEIEAASFKGVTPGETTIEEVEKNWGAPKEIQKQDSMLLGVYKVDPFERVEVTFFDDTVTSVVIRLDRAFPAGAVARQLELADVRPVLVSNSLGEILGQAYPERGVLFAFEPNEGSDDGPMKVSQIILEPISAEPFVLRAETNLEDNYDFSLADLEQALKLQPDNARAHWLHCRVLNATGNREEALEAINEAVRLEPEDAQYRVTRARVLGQLGRFQEARRDAQRAIDTSQPRPHVKASAICLLGDLLASGPAPDYAAAIEHHMNAVKLADTLVTNRHPAIRLAAKEVMIDAHLGAAHDIAWGRWKQKEEAVTRWLTRADAFAEELVESEGDSREHLFRVSTRALAACVGLRGQMDPGKWTTQAIQNAEQLIATTDDALHKSQLKWDLGMALYDALQIYQMRDDHESALKYGERAVGFLESGNPLKQSNNGYLLGRLYFRLGAIYAIRDQNHRAAITWFEKATPLLKASDPAEGSTDLGRHGETLVSMGVSYWETGQREKAVELTEEGIKWMEKAVDDGTLDKSALSVPYGNLASMHRQLGNDGAAKRFEGLADKSDGNALQ